MSLTEKKQYAAWQNAENIYRSRADANNTVLEIKIPIRTKQETNVQEVKGVHGREKGRVLHFTSERKIGVSPGEEMPAHPNLINIKANLLKFSMGRTALRKFPHARLQLLKSFARGGYSSVVDLLLST